MLNGIRVRLFASYFLLIMLTLALVGSIFFSVLVLNAVKGRQQRLAACVQDAQAVVDAVGGRVPLDMLNRWCQARGAKDSALMTLFDARGRECVSTSEGRRASEGVSEIARHAMGAPSGTFWKTARGLHLSRPLLVRGKVVGYLDCELGWPDMHRDLRRLQLSFAAVGGVLTALAMLLAAFLSRRVLRPVARVREVAAGLASGNLGVRAPVEAEDEIGELGRTINSLAEEIQRNIDSVTAEKNKLDAILSSMVDGVVTVRAGGIVTFANSVAGRIIADYGAYRRSIEVTVGPSSDANEPSESTVGVQAPEEAAEPGDPDEGPVVPEPATRSIFMSRLVGNNLFAVTRPNNVGELVKACLTSGDVVTREMQLGEKEFNVNAIPIGTSHGRLTSDEEAEALVLFRDITSLRQLEIARNQFLGNVSHELKTPLTIIKGFVVTLLKSPGITGEWKRYLDYIDRESDRLARLVDDVLNLARLRSKRTQMNLSFCDPLDVLKETYRQLLPQAAKYDVLLKFDTPSTLPVLLADADRFKEVVINLVDNAFKYSPPQTRVCLKAEATPEHLVLTVGDSGPGIPADEVPFLFERFFRGSEKGGRKSGGSGIGLAIVKEIVDAHHGTIRVESKVGEGTSFIIELPLRQKGRRRTDR